MVEHHLTARPKSLDELCEAVANANSIRVFGSDSESVWSCLSVGEWDRARLLLPKDQLRLELVDLTGIVEWTPSDQVVSVRAGTPLIELQLELATKGQCLPLVEWYDGYATTNFNAGTIGGGLSLNLPHFLESSMGNWRDWVLGVTAVLPDGQTVQCGSRAVKNVAGYDIQKLLVGSRGTLAIVVEVILRTFTIVSLPKPSVWRRQVDKPRIRSNHWWCQRAPLAELPTLTENAQPFAHMIFPESGVLFAEIPPEKSLPRIDGDWVIRSGCGEKNVQITDPNQIRLMKRAKQIFDPTNKLNPGEWGFM